MNEQAPAFLNLAFISTVILSILMFMNAVNNPRRLFIILTGWSILQGLIAYTGFYTVSKTIPPRFILMVAPPLITIAILFSSKKGRAYIDGFSLKALTLLHIIRVPVELILFYLCFYKLVPELMTFSGRNFDILSGLTAPFIYYYSFKKKHFNRNLLLIWNIICLLLLLNIVIHAVLSAPFVFQKLAFEQANVAVLYFPFNLLPATVVPIVLFAHLAAIRQLIRSGRSN